MEEQLRIRRGIQSKVQVIQIIILEHVEELRELSEKRFSAESRSFRN